ncbi:glycosyltransferase family 39 protein [Lachnoclostridium sp. An138]|uniref:glycosyltransferase family 39 protein n=1 Tax=Lachnoclostridium sp. An138 TaxID=1965560 RepID=UPI000B3A809A|nr:glycosyltransferase family 39 protein [Lachnoclostridium sp. An138]OUQ17777.1 hypothetical protein B5E82_10135 [Lachnoclostridium sp. An138]
MCSQIKAARGWYKQQEKGTRVMLTILTAAVTFYLVFLLWLLPEMMETVPMDTKYWTVKILAALLMTVPVYLGLQWCVYRLSGAELKESGAGTDSIPDENAGENRDAAEKKEKMRRRFWFFLGFSLVFAWLMVYFYAYFPGSFDWDNLDQWWQIQNSQYDTWHPVFHTLIIALFTKVVNHYGFAVFMQLLLYSLLCGYLLYTMAKWRFPVWGMLLAEFFLAANPQTHRILLFMWKDSALTLFMLLFTVYLIHVWKSGGRWLKKKRNLAVWILVLISISLVRHNSILYTIPFLILAVFFFKEIRRESIISLVLMLAGMWVIQYPVYNLVGASRPSQTYVETVGVPMTILCNIHETAPESLDPEAAEFLAEIGPEKRWDIYEMGNYNSFKFVTNANQVISSTDPLDFLSFTARTAANAPGLSLQAVYQVTRMVWDIRGTTPWHTDLEYQIQENEWNFSYVEDRAGMRTVLNDFDNWVMDSALDTLFSYNGIHLLALILCTLFVFARKGKGWKALVLTLPVLAYNYGTMLLLCGPTYRFFHFDSVIFVPLCLLLFSGWKTAVPENNM